MKIIGERTNEKPTEEQDPMLGMSLALQTISQHLGRLADTSHSTDLILAEIALTLADISKRMRRKKTAVDSDLQRASDAYVDSKLHTAPETMLELVHSVQNRHAIDSKELKRVQHKYQMLMESLTEMADSLATNDSPLRDRLLAMAESSRI